MISCECTKKKKKTTNDIFKWPLDMKTDLKSLCLNLFLGVPLYRITAATPTENHRQIMNMHRKSFFTSSIQISILTESLPPGSRSNKSILKELSPEYSLEGLMLNLKLQYFGHLMRKTDSFEKTLMLGKIEGRRRRR